METPARLDAAGLITLVADLATLDCADPVDLVETIAQLERLKNAAAAAQARATVALRSVRESEARATGRSVRRVAGSVAGEVGLARRESQHRAGILVGLAALLAEMPHASAAFTAGEVSEWRVTVLARETACLSRADRALADAELGPRLAHLSTGQLCAEARSIAYRLDPHGVVRRIGKAEQERRVTCRPAPDCMTYLTGLLPAADGVAVFAALTMAADQARAAGDQRSKGQVMADTLVGRVTGREPAAGPGVEVQLVMTDEALLSGSETPARLAGYGPIPASVARRLAEVALDTDRAWVRRLYAAPGEGRLVAMESASRRFGKGMRAFIKTRDNNTCRTPYCGAPIRHIDHVVPAGAGGTTTITNGQGLCERCNYLKEQPGWRVTTEPDGTITIQTPTGHRYISRPPDLPHEMRAVKPAPPSPIPIFMDFFHQTAA